MKQGDFMEHVIDKLKKFIRDEIRDANEDVLKKAASMGWTIPPDLPYSNFKLLFNDPNVNPTDADTKLTTYYLENIDELFQCIEISLTKIQMPEYLSWLVKETIQCYNLGLYQVCVPSLFSALEGVMTFYLDDRIATKYKDSHLSKTMDTNISIESIGLISISEFLENNFNSTSFSLDEETFCKLNRHWALHGKYKKKLTQASVIKLFVAVGSALMTAELLKST